MFHRYALRRFLPAAGLLTLLGSLATLLWCLDRFNAAEQKVERTRDAIEEVYKARYGALRSGIWLRNFALNPAPEMLGRVRSTAAEAEAAVRRLGELTEGDETLNPQAHALVREMGDLLEAYRSGADLAEQQGVEALKPVLHSRVQVDHTRRVRDRLQAIEDGARQALGQQRHVERAYLEQIRQLAGLLAALATGLLLWAVLRAVRFLRRRRAGAALSSIHPA